MVYKQHRAAFASVSAYVVLHNGERAATIAFKFPRDGAGRLYSYVHWLGSGMARGFAAGGGYDKTSAACASTARKMSPGADTENVFIAALAKDDGNGWETNLRKAGFDVWQAV
jgi:hypothetical protein